jgi:hypothetical protein
MPPIGFHLVFVPNQMLAALRAAQSVTQRLEDYWLGLRLQDMDIPAIHLVKANHVDDSSPLMLDAVENYLPYQR